MKYRKSNRKRRYNKKRGTRKLRGGNNSLTLVEVPHFIERTHKKIDDEVSGIPLKIYQAWHSKMIPPKMKESVDKLIQMNPEFNYYMYSDDDCIKFITENFDKDVLDAYNLLKPSSYKSDLWRWCILYKLGGVYLDIKFYSNIPLITLLEKYGEVFALDVDNSSAACESKQSIVSGFVITKPNNPIFKGCIDKIVEYCKNRSYTESSLSVTGPCLLGLIVKEHMKGIDLSSHIKFKLRVEESGDNTVVSIVNENTPIVTQYPEYRIEQKRIQKEGAHYSEVWNRRDIYNK